MKKKKFVSILLLGVVSVLPILCILMIHHLSLCVNLERMETGSFGESSCLVSMTVDSTTVDSATVNSMTTTPIITNLTEARLASMMFF